MARKAGSPKTGTLNVFFLNGMLHRKLRIVRATDTIETWCYPENRRVAYTYSDVRKNYERAYSTKEVSEMISRSVRSIKQVLETGGIEQPHVMTSLTVNKTKHAYRWNEEDIMRLHTYYLNTHRGRPRKDGRITPQALPTARELRAMIRQEQVLYVRNEDGNFVPTWQAEDFT